MSIVWCLLPKTEQVEDLLQISHVFNQVGRITIIVQISSIFFKFCIKSLWLAFKKCTLNKGTWEMVYHSWVTE